MECEKLLDALHKDFTRITNESKMFQKGASIYAKEIRRNIFLLICTSERKDSEPVQATIANFDCIESVGIGEPTQILFHLKINSEEDLHYLKKYLSLSI